MLFLFYNIDSAEFTEFPTCAVTPPMADISYEMVLGS